jgi:putative oxidoreductase
MERWLGKFSPHLYVVLRIVAGFVFALHGTQKILGFPGSRPPMPLASQMGLAGIIEMVGGVLVMVGLFTTYAAFIASGEMAVAYFQRHSPNSFFPTVNGGEAAVLYCFVFLYIASTGSGIWSLEKIVMKRKA